MLKRVKVVNYNGKSGRGVIKELETNRFYEGPVYEVGANYRLRLALDGLAGKICLAEFVNGKCVSLRLLKKAG